LRCESHAEDSAQIVRTGRLPLTVLLVEQRGRSVVTLFTTVTMGGRVVH
jgi:hypothetical protein